MYEKNKSKQITLRLSKEQFDHCQMLSEIAGISVSDIIRQFINANLYAYRKALVDMTREENEHK